MEALRAREVGETWRANQDKYEARNLAAMLRMGGHSLTFRTTMGIAGRRARVVHHDTV